MYVIRYSRQALRDLERLDPKIQDRIRRQIETKLVNDPEAFGKPLKSTLAGFKSLRVGDWRVIYTADGHIVAIISIFHRSKGYS